MGYAETAVYELLAQASRGRIGVDQRLIHSIVDRGDAAVHDLLKFGLEDHSEDPVGLELDVVQIFRILRTPKALDYYVRLVEAEPYDVPDELVEGFIELGAPAVEPLLELYDKLGEEEGGEVAFLLAGIGVKDDRIRRILIDRIDYDLWDAAILLGTYADPATREAIEKAMAGVPKDAENEPLLRDLEHALEQLGRESEVHEPPTAEAIIDEYPDEALPEFDVLVESERLALLESADAEERLGAAESFIAIQLSDTARQRLFEVARADADSQVRAAAWRGLSGETENKEIREAMLARLADSSAPAVERGGALIGLANDFEGEPKRYAEAMYGQPETRAAALEAMRRSLDRSFAPYFPEHLDDENLDVKRQAIWGVGYLGIASAAEKLKEFFNDEELRPDALFAYALSTRAETTRGRMKGLLRKIDTLAGGLAGQEEDLVKAALDERLQLYGLDPVFAEEEHVHGPECDHDHEHVEPVPPSAVKAGRNDPCPCGSGKKFKKCCGA
jgi:hypothetical protein